VSRFRIEPRGPFVLEAAKDFAGGFAPGLGGHAAGMSANGLLLAFPVEGWRTSAAIDLWQDADGIVHGEAYGPDGPLDAADLEVARSQAARSVSLDHDGAEWPAVGVRDPVIGALQARFSFLRPVCFYSAYEAAASLVIGQRISMEQGAKVKRRLADDWGDRIEIGGREVHAFPRPQQLLEVAAIPGLATSKVTRLHGLAEAALSGMLDTSALRAMPEDEALARLATLPGVGLWTAQGILMRGCGPTNTLPTADLISREAVRVAYGLSSLPDDETWVRISEAWRPYRMWATVLLHMAWRRDQAETPSYRRVGSGAA
jgi:DNA-3-methyladenine glycosylase II